MQSGNLVFFVFCRDLSFSLVLLFIWLMLGRSRTSSASVSSEQEKKRIVSFLVFDQKWMIDGDSMFVVSCRSNLWQIFVRRENFLFSFCHFLLLHLVIVQLSNEFSFPPLSCEMKIVSFLFIQILRQLVVEFKRNGKLLSFDFDIFVMWHWSFFISIPTERASNFDFNEKYRLVVNFLLNNKRLSNHCFFGLPFFFSVFFRRTRSSTTLRHERQIDFLFSSFFLFLIRHSSWSSFEKETLIFRSSNVRFFSLNGLLVSFVQACRRIASREKSVDQILLSEEKKIFLFVNKRTT